MRLVAAFGLGLVCASAGAQDSGANQFPPEQIKKGGDIYGRNCAPCHGRHMANPEWAIDLRTFSQGERPRFIYSVTYGKNSMPPWGDLLKPEDIEALWAYVVAGERKE